MITLRAENIADESHQLLPGCGGEGVGLLAGLERQLARAAAPDVHWYEESVATGFWRALLGDRRDFFVVFCSRFPEHHVLVGCRDHGSDLTVSRYLVVSPCLRRDLRRALRLGTDQAYRFDIGSELDPFEFEDLMAFLSVVRQALEAAVRSLLARPRGDQDDGGFPSDPEDPDAIPDGEE